MILESPGNTQEKVLEIHRKPLSVFCMHPELRLNRLTFVAFCHTFIGWVTSPVCPQCGSGDGTAEHNIFFSRKWDAELHHTYAEFIDVADVFQ